MRHVRLCQTTSTRLGQSAIVILVALAFIIIGAALLIAGLNPAFQVPSEAANGGEVGAGAVCILVGGFIFKVAG